jgi:iron complex transport system substrate-binding protein
MRIVSLLPSTTEILFAVGAGDNVVGVTFECDFPPEARSRPIVSTSTLPEGLSPAQIDTVVKERVAAGEDLYRLDAGALRDLDPDVVVTQDLCAVCATTSAAGPRSSPSTRCCSKRSLSQSWYSARSPATKAALR